MPIDETGNHYVDLISAPAVADLSGDPEIERDAQHPAMRAAVVGLKSMSPPAGGGAQEGAQRPWWRRMFGG